MRNDEAGQRQAGEEEEEAHEGPASSVSPFVLAGGIAMLIFGIGITPVASVIGAVLVVIAVAGWIGDLRHVA